MYEEVKNISKHYAVYASGSIISKAIGFIMIPVYTRYITTAEYGILGIINLLIWVVGLIIGMNVTAGITRFYFYYKNKEEKNAVISTSLFFIIFFAILSTTFLIYFSAGISRILFQSTDYALYLKLAFASIFFEMLLPIPFACFRLKNTSMRFLRFSLLQLFVALGLNILLIVFLKLGILGILYSQLITDLIISLLLLYITFKEFGFTFSLDPLKRILSYSLPLIPAGLAMIVLNLGDRYILKRFVSLEEVGIYTLGYKIVMMLGFLVGGPFRFVWQPYRFSIADDKSAPHIYSKVFTYFTLFVAFIGLGFAVLSKEIVRLAATSPYYRAADVIPAVTMGYIFYQLYYMLNIGMMLGRETVWVAFVVSAAAFLNVVMNFLLIPKMGIMAAAYATLVSFAFLAIATYFISQKFYRISYEFSKLGKIAVCGLGLYFVSTLVDTGNLWNNFYIKALLILVFPFILYITGFYGDEEIKSIYRLFKDIQKKYAAISVKIINILNVNSAE